MEQEKIIEKAKKPIYKKWWFWLIIVFILLIIIGAQEDSTTNSTGSTSKTKVATAKKVEVSVIDFSTMTYDNILAWGIENNVKISNQKAYSDSVAKDGFVSQNVTSGGITYEGATITITYSLGKEPTLSQKNAVKKAEQYLDTMAFSRSGLIKQLEYEGFSKAEATYGVDNITVDWNAQALKKAEQYLDTMAFSRSGLIKQLEYEGFSKAEATYGVDGVGL